MEQVPDNLRDAKAWSFACFVKPWKVLAFIPVNAPTARTFRHYSHEFVKKLQKIE